MSAASEQKRLERIVEAFAINNPLETIWHERWIQEFSGAMHSVLGMQDYGTKEEMEADPEFMKRSSRLANVRQQMLAIYQMHNLSIGEGMVVLMDFCVAVLALHEFTRGTFEIGESLKNLGFDTTEPTDTKN